MDTKLNIESHSEISCLQLQKMAFLFNAVEDGWNVKKVKDMYVFTKNHEGKKEIFLDSYLKRFVEDNFDINKINK